jgi:hypothetical protein
MITTYPCKNIRADNLIKVHEPIKPLQTKTDFITNSSNINQFIVSCTETMLDNHSHTEAPLLVSCNTEAPQMAAPNTRTVVDSLCSAGLRKRRSWHPAGECEGEIILQRFM